MRNQEVRILTRKIDRIFEQVYSMNESMSVENKRQMVLGFEDGINELFGKDQFAGRFVRNLARGAKSVVDTAKSGAEKAKATYNTMVSKGKEYYEKGKKLAGDAWDAMVNFGKKVLNGIEEGYNKAVESVVSNYNTFVESVKGAYQQAVNSVVEAYSQMKEKAEAFKEYFKGLYNDILAKTTKLIQDTKEKISETKEKISEWLESNKSSIEKSIDDAKRSGIDSMNELAEMAKKGLTKGGKLVGSVVIIICFGSIYLLVEGIKKVPGIYDAAMEMTKNYVKKELVELNARWEEGWSGDEAKESFRHIKTFENFKY